MILTCSIIGGRGKKVVHACLDGPGCVALCGREGVTAGTAKFGDYLKDENAQIRPVCPKCAKKAALLAPSCDPASISAPVAEHRIDEPKVAVKYDRQQFLRCAAADKSLKAKIEDIWDDLAPAELESTLRTMFNVNILGDSDQERDYASHANPTLPPGCVEKIVVVRMGRMESLFLGDICHDNNVAVSVDIYRYVLDDAGARTGRIRRVGFRKLKDIMADLEEYLHAKGCEPCYERFVVNTTLDRKTSEWPCDGEIMVYARKGANEGHQVEVAVFEIGRHRGGVNKTHYLFHYKTFNGMEHALRVANLFTVALYGEH